MQTESDIGQYEIREVDENFPRGVRRSENHNNKLPPLGNNKNSEMDYAKRNMEIIKQLKEKKQKQQEQMEEKRKKETEEREKLRQLILEEAARVRELKKQNNALQQETELKEDEEQSFRGKKSKTKEIREKEEEETEKEKEDKAKLQHYYRSRHASFLKSLKENLKSKKEKEEQEKKKKDEILSKIRENMGINNITSKLYSVEKNYNEKPETAMDEQTLNCKKVNSASEAKRANSVEGRTLPIEVQRELLHRQKKILAEISERKKLEKLEEEEKQKHYLKIKEKLKDKVLNMGKRVDGYETAGFGVERKALSEDPVASQNLKALNLDSVETKRQRFKKSLGSLPPIRDKYLSENDDGQKESSSLPKIPESTKSSKSGKKNPKKKLANIPNITDMVQWKKRHRIDPDAKIYNVNGGYGDIKAALDKRGWIENPDFSSPCFDFKWTLRAKDIDHGSLLENQIVNHFEKNTSITTKVGLCKSLKNLIWFNNVDIDTFYPRCFDLTDVADYEDFLDEFKRVKAESILKQYVTACKNNDPKVKDMELRVQVAARVCENRLIDLDELLDDQTMISHVLVSPEEWEILANDELSAKDLALKKHEAWLSKYDITNGPKCAFRKKKAEKGKKKKKKKKAVKQAEEDNNNNKEEGDGEEDDNASENELLDRVETILEELKAKYPQYGLNGEKNIWIVKPAGLSRGRGISCFRNLVEIQDYVKGKESQWVVQKYLENPLIIHKRKFDIRQWILVTDWNPLTIWYYEECYVRFSAEEYGTENLDNKFVHLTNNSIGKYHENQDCPTFEQNMWGMETFAKYLEQTFGSGTFEEKIKPQMKQIVTWALECVQDMVENRKGSHEFYGVDFMIDEDLNVWLIEINSSPDMEYSTPVTKRLVKTVSDDIIKVVVDYNLNPTKKKKKEIDTGLFTCTHKSKRTIEKPLNSFGLDLHLEGKKISK